MRVNFIILLESNPSIELYTCALGWCITRVTLYLLYVMTEKVSPYCACYAIVLCNARQRLLIWFSIC